MVMRSAPTRVWGHGPFMSHNTQRPPSRIAVQVAQGNIYGVRDELPNGEHYYYFKGIPYAKPPVGNLRFRSPVPIEKYSVSYLDCTKEGKNCMGMDIFTKEITGHEEGLFLNIYTPKMPPKNQPEPNKLPVLVFIHGGGLIGGHGDSSMYLPNYMIQENMLVVTVNYRLGVLGFLCLPEAGIEGNAGLKDQRLALQWVHQNIEKFSGDPDNVTLFGASAGAIAVHYHCLSKESKKYFHKAILTSGSAFMDYAHQEAPEEKARQLARLLGHNPKSDEEVLQVLTNAPAKKLFELQLKVFSKREESVEKLFQLPFLPVIEQEQSPDPIITKHPMEIMCEPDGMGIPMITGYNDREGMIVLNDAVKQLPSYNEEPERFIPRTLNIDYESPEAGQVGKAIKHFYFKDKPVGHETITHLVDVFSDKYLILSIPIMNELWARFQRNHKLFIYRFSFDGLLNKGKTLVPYSSLKGASHIDEVYYLFSAPILKTEIPKSSESFAMRQKMVRMWANFARQGHPTENDEELALNWEPVQNIPVDSKESRIDVLDIGDDIRMMPIPERARMDFWMELFAKYNGHAANTAVPRKPFQGKKSLV
ncbi:esterase FE4-like [Uranotaenia lowii]|uniref:esterase FE4-like n=1 Tax=Uranotaenia lowii TaxID=190385 RepID=UPI00247ACE5E|nr:esterase FE4-like [Uranotaenia lowii]